MEMCHVLGIVTRTEDLAEKPVRHDLYDGKHEFAIGSAVDEKACFKPVRGATAKIEGIPLDSEFQQRSSAAQMDDVYVATGRK